MYPACPSLPCYELGFHIMSVSSFEQATRKNGSIYTLKLKYAWYLVVAWVLLLPSLSFVKKKQYSNCRIEVLSVLFVLAGVVLFSVFFLFIIHVAFFNEIISRLSQPNPVLPLSHCIHIYRCWSNHAMMSWNDTFMTTWNWCKNDDTVHILFAHYHFFNTSVLVPHWSSQRGRLSVLSVRLIRRAFIYHDVSESHNWYKLIL